MTAWRVARDRKWPVNIELAEHIFCIIASPVQIDWCGFDVFFHARLIAGWDFENSVEGFAAFSGQKKFALSQ